MSKACIKIAAVIAEIGALYCSHAVGGRNKILLPGGRFFSLMPQRCICLQSKIGLANWTTDVTKLK